MRTAGIAGLFVALSIAGVAREGWAQVVNIGFESPTYTAGNLLGQDGWAKNFYYPDPLGGTVEVSNSSPLVGSQSLSYTQTATTGTSDVHKPNVVLVPPGMQGKDLTLTYSLRAESNSFGAGFGGIFLQPVGGSGASPIIAYVNNGAITVNAGSVPLDQFFFLDGETLDFTYEIDFGSLTMDFTVLNQEDGSQYTANYPFLGGYDPSGPNGEYVVSVAALLRGGNVQIDNINLEVSQAPIESQYEWTATGSGNWNAVTNWTPSGLPGAVNGEQSVLLGSAITATQTIFNSETRNLNALDINNANSYIVAGAGLLQFEANTTGTNPLNPTIDVASGAHQIQIAVELIDDLSVTVAGGASIDFNNVIDLNGNTLTISGTVRINHSTIGGGTVNSSGALMANGVSSVGGNLVSTGALVVGVDADGADAFAVAGDATLSGILDVQWDSSNIPTAPMTIVSAGGTLDATGLALAADDAKSFALGVDGSNLTLTFLGAAVPEPNAVALMLTCIGGLVLRRRTRRIVPIGMSAGLAACLAMATTPAAAQTGLINFESPTYTTGNIIGQNGWVINSYVGAPNGTAEVSTASPLAGSQSLLYTQTSASGFATDLSKAYVGFGTADGTTAVDLTASVKLQSLPNTSPAFPAGRIGMYLSAGAFGGSSPIGVFLNGTTLEGLHNTGFYAAGTVPANNVIEFQLGVNFDNGDYEVTYRDVTANGPVTPLVGPLAGGRFAFFDNPNAFPADGDSITRTVDVGLFLRGGVGRVDDLTVVGDDFLEARWFANSGSWSQNLNWIPQLIPNATASTNAQIAVFGASAVPQSVFTNATQTVNGLRFDAGAKYAIGGAGSLTLRANTIGGTVNPTINVVAGSHELQLTLNVQNNTAVSVATGASLDVNNTVALGGRTLTNSGAGALNLNFGVTGGGSISNSGTLGTAGTTPIAANLTSTGTLQIDLGEANTDFFNITGTATLSGVLDVVMEPGFTPTGNYTVLTSAGTLSAGSLTLHPSDLADFTLSIAGNSVVLVTGGTATIPGDFDGNGTVNGADLTEWKGDFGVNNDDSDADGDGDSDGRDFLVWQRNLGQPAATLTAASVPEPAAVVLAAMSAAVCGSIVRRRK